MAEQLSKADVRDHSNYTIWGGYMETPVSCDFLGDMWLADLEFYRDEAADLDHEEALTAYIDDNLDDLCMMLEEAGYFVEE